MKFLKKIFCPNWQPVWTKSGTWEYVNTPIIHGVRMTTLQYDTHEPYTVQIFYSKIRNKYKIVCSGKEPELSEAYTEAVSKLNELTGIVVL